MSVEEYKASIKSLVDATDNEILLKHWKAQLEKDIQSQSPAELSEEEWKLVEEGLADYNSSAVMTLEEFIKAR